MVLRTGVHSFLSSGITDFLIIESGSRRRLTSYRERLRSCLGIICVLSAFAYGTA